jgi:hypothetical protein
MRRFVKYISTIIAICLALMFALDALYTYAFTSGVPRSKLQHILKQENKTYDYLFLGSSRTEFHIDCDLIEELTGKSCINYGISGTTFKDSYSVLRLMDARGIKFKNVFVQVDYMYNDTGYSPNFRARLLAQNKEPIVKEVLKDYDVSFADKYVPFYRYIINDHLIGFREVFSLFAGVGSKTNFENGYIPKFGIHDYAIESLPTNIIESNSSINVMVDYFTEHSVQSFFFIAPICDSTLDRDLYVELLKLKIPSLNDYVSLYDGEDEGFYFDCGHLNASGAQNFTRILTNDLILNKK